MRPEPLGKLLSRQASASIFVKRGKTCCCARENAAKFVSHSPALGGNDPCLAFCLTVVVIVGNRAGMTLFGFGGDVIDYITFSAVVNVEFPCT